MVKAIVTFLIATLLFLIGNCAHNLDKSYEEYIDHTYYAPKELESVLKKAQWNDLVIFDIDETIISLKDEIFHPKNLPLYLFYKRVKLNDYCEEKKCSTNSYLALWDRQKHFRFMGKGLPKMVKGLMDRGVHVMALTAYPTTYYGKYWMAKGRIEHLKKMGFDFSSSFNRFHQIPLAFKSKDSGFFQSASKGNSEKDEFPSAGPVFYKGVLFTDQKIGKGPLLTKFLKTVDWKPAHIYFIDDNAQHLASVKKEMEILDLPTVTIHYMAKINLPRPKLSRYHFDRQFKYFLKHKVWQSDAQLINLGRMPSSQAEKN